MFDVEKFIACVKKRPALYDVGSKEYSNRQTKTRCWNEVGAEMYDDWDHVSVSYNNNRGKELMRKWKAIRDNFVRDYKLFSKSDLEASASKKKQKYLFYDHLLFLAPHLKSSNKTPSTAPQAIEEDPLREKEFISSLMDDISGSNQNEPRPPEASVFVAVRGDSPTSPRPKRKGVKRRAAVQTIASASKDLTQEIQESVAVLKEECNSDRNGNRAFLLSYLPFMDMLPQQAQLQARMLVTQVFNDLLCPPVAPPCESD